MERSVLGTSSRGWFCQTLKQEPSCPKIPSPHLRSRNGTSVYLSHPLDISPGCTTASAWGNGGVGGAAVAMGNPMSRLGFSCASAFPHSFVAPAGPLTRTHAMHSLFESYTIESVGGGVVGGGGGNGIGASREYASTTVRMAQIPDTMEGKPDCELLQTARRNYLRPRRTAAASSFCNPDAEEGEATDGDSQGSVRKCLHHHHQDEEAVGDEGGDEGGMSSDRQISGSRASYMCRKCKAHGQAVPVKRHKRACPYIHCQCLKCRLVDQGRKVVARQIALYRDQKGQANGERSTARLTAEVNRQRAERVSSLLEQLPGEETGSEPGRLDLLPLVPQLPNVFVRSAAATDGPGAGAAAAAVGPHCRRCRNHQVAVTWKGHKKSCPYRNCPCDPCRLINVRKDTEKTLRDMAGIEEKATLQLSITSRRTNPGSFLPYLASAHSRLEVEGITSQQIEPVHLDLQGAGQEQTGYSVKTRLDSLEITNSGAAFFPFSPRRTRSIQEVTNEVSTGSSGDGGSLIGSDSLPRSSQRRPDTLPPEDLYQNNEVAPQSVTSPPLNCDTDNRNLSLEASSTSPSLGTNPLSEFSDSLTAAATYSQHHRSSAEIFYYDSLPETRRHLQQQQEEKTTTVLPPPPPAARTMLPFWQSFGHLETEKTSEMLGGAAPSYLGGGTAAAAALYYPGSMHGGHVFHGQTGGHMYSPERVSAVAAAAAAAAAMVAMTPPINNAYPQACYGQNRGGFYPTQFPPPAPPAEQTYSCMNGESIDYGWPNGSFREYPYAPRLLQGTERESERQRLSGGRSDQFSGHWSSGYGWGTAYRYPYMMRNLPLSATASSSTQYSANEPEPEAVLPPKVGGTATTMDIVKGRNQTTLSADKEDSGDDQLSEMHHQQVSPDDTARSTRDMSMRRSQMHQLSISRLNSTESNFKIPVTCSAKSEEQMDKGKPGSMDLALAENTDQSLNALRTARGSDNGNQLNATMTDVGPQFSLSSFPSAYSSRRFFADAAQPPTPAPPPPPPQSTLLQPEGREVFGRTSSPTGVAVTEAFFPPRGLQDFRDQRHQQQQHEDVDVVETKLSPVKVLGASLSETFQPPTPSTSSTVRGANQIFVTSPTQDTINPPAFLVYARPPPDGALRVG